MIIHTRNEDVTSPPNVIKTACMKVGGQSKTVKTTSKNGRELHDHLNKKQSNIIKTSKQSLYDVIARIKVGEATSRLNLITDRLLAKYDENGTFDYTFKNVNFQRVFDIASILQTQAGELVLQHIINKTLSHLTNKIICDK